MRRRFDTHYLFFAAVYAVQGLIGLAFLPIYYLQQEVLGLGPAQSAMFTLAMTLPPTLKPVLGLLSDALPIRGRRRLAYLRFTPLIACGAWIALATRSEYTYASALGLIVLANLGTVFSDVLCDAVMVERGKRLGKTGAYQAVQIGALYLALTVSGYGGGWLAENVSYQTVFALVAPLPLLVFAAGFLAEDPKVPQGPRLGVVARELWALARNRVFWTVCLIILLWNFIPYAGTAFFYYQSGPLGFTKEFFGGLGSLDTLMGTLGSVVFWRFRAPGRDTERLVRAAVVVGAPATLMYLFFVGPVSALIITAVFGLIGLVLRLSLMDLAAQHCPKHLEGTAFALYMAAFNVAASASNTLGAFVYDRAANIHGAPYLGIAVLVLVAAAAKVACWPLLAVLFPKR